VQVHEAVVQRGLRCGSLSELLLVRGSATCIRAVAVCRLTVKVEYACCRKAASCAAAVLPKRARRTPCMWDVPEGRCFCAHRALLSSGAGTAFNDWQVEGFELQLQCLPLAAGFAGTGSWCCWLPSFSLAWHLLATVRVSQRCYTSVKCNARFECHHRILCNSTPLGKADHHTCIKLRTLNCVAAGRGA
jgi:hypothetical protein